MSTGTFDSNVTTTPAVNAVGTNGAFGVQGNSDSGTGVFGSSNSDSDGNAGVSGQSNSGTGVLGQSVLATGVLGRSNSDGTGVLGQSNSGIGVAGRPPSGTGVFGQSDGNAGVSGQSNSGTGVLGQSDNGIGVTGRGVSGQSNGGRGVKGESDSGTGVFGQSNSGFAGEFDGNVLVGGKLTKAGGGFQIDHPLDPAHKSLSHSFVESPDMKNLYDGVVVLDANGEAEVELPSWFEALTTEFRYQLTPIGASAPELYIVEKIHGNRFRIAGGKPAMEVSWQVTGIRQDAWAKAYRLPVEQDKPAHEQGYYWHPDLHGESKEKSLLRARYPELKTPVLPEQ